jgi:hypothetical protein
MEASPLGAGPPLNHGVFRRQDLPPAYIPDGGVLVVSRAALFCEIPGVEPGRTPSSADDASAWSTRRKRRRHRAPIDLVVADAILSRQVVSVATIAA